MSYLHKAKILLSILSLLAGVGFNISLHEVGIHWHYPVLSLLFTSGSAIVVFGIAQLVVNHRSPKPPRLRATSLSKRLSSNPQTNIQVTTTTWKWEFPASDSTTSVAESTPTITSTSTASISTALPTSTTPLSGNDSKFKTIWGKHKHFLACGCLLAGEGICAVFTAPQVTYQWQIFAFQFIFPLTYFLHEYALTKASTRLKQGGLIIIAFGGFLNGVPLVLDTSFNGWCGMFAASAVFAAFVSVYIGFLFSIQFHPVEIAVWSNVYLFVIILLATPLYAFTGLQGHGFSDLFWYQKLGLKCLASSLDPCRPYGYAFALAFVALFAIYFILQAMLTKAEDASVQAGINSLALPIMALIYQVEQSANAKLIYPITSIIVIIVGIVVCKMQTISREYALTKPYRF